MLHLNFCEWTQKSTCEKPQWPGSFRRVKGCACLLSMMNVWCPRALYKSQGKGRLSPDPVLILTCQRPQGQWPTVWDSSITAKWWITWKLTLDNLKKKKHRLDKRPLRGLWSFQKAWRTKLVAKEEHCPWQAHRIGSVKKLMPASLLCCYGVFVQGTPFHPQPGAKENHHPTRKTYSSGKISQLLLSERETWVKGFLLTLVATCGASFLGLLRDTEVSKIVLVQ